MKWGHLVYCVERAGARPIRVERRVHVAVGVVMVRRSGFARHRAAAQALAVSTRWQVGDTRGRDGEARSRSAAAKARRSELNETWVGFPARRSVKPKRDDGQGERKAWRDPKGICVESCFLSEARLRCVFHGGYGGSMPPRDCPMGVRCTQPILRFACRRGHEGVMPAISAGMTNVTGVPALALVRLNPNLKNEQRRRP